MTTRRRKNAAAMKALTKQAVAFLRSERSKELKPNAHRSKRDGNGCPLSAWMVGAPRNSQSKIMSVCNGEASYPYKTLTASSSVLCDRLAKRYNLVGAAHYALEHYVSRFYRWSKQCNFAGYLPRDRPDAQIGNAIAARAYDWLICDCSERKPIPLRAILSPHFADLVLQYSLYETLGELNGR